VAHVPPHFLLTNDDGVDAAGLAALGEAVRSWADTLTFASLTSWSGCGHRVTTDQPVQVVRRSADCYVTTGTPADCVRFGLEHMAPGTSWVLSGINHGGNLGADVYMSGTVAAVREGVLHGFPGIAVSHYRRKGEAFDWPRATRWVAPLIKELVARPWTPGTFWNINLPHLPADAADPEVVFCRVDPSPLPISYTQEGELRLYNGNYHERPRQPGTDVDVCFRGQIAVSQIPLF